MLIFVRLKLRAALFRAYTVCTVFEGFIAFVVNFFTFEGSITFVASTGCQSERIRLSKLQAGGILA